MAPRAATRDAARVLGFDYATGDRIAKQIPEPVLGRNPSFKDCLADGEEPRYPPTTSLAHLQERFGATLPYLDGALVDEETERST